MMTQSHDVDAPTARAPEPASPRATEMIERMARAHCWFCGEGQNHLWCGCKSEADCWDWQNGVAEMRAALSAMRKPTTHMQFAGHAAIEKVHGEMIHKPVSPACWDAMIDAAFEDGP